MSKVFLQDRQVVWVETYSSLFSSDYKRQVVKFEVVESNKSSAYIIPTSKSEVYRENPKQMKYKTIKIAQGSLQRRDFFGATLNIWITKKEFEDDVQLKNKRKELLPTAHTLIEGLSNDELSKFIDKHMKEEK